jgi:hypothetical protein
MFIGGLNNRPQESHGSLFCLCQLIENHFSQSSIEIQSPQARGPGDGPGGAEDQ